jgi:hypothetical protein
MSPDEALSWCFPGILLLQPVSVSCCAGHERERLVRSLPTLLLQDHQTHILSCDASGAAPSNCLSVRTMMCRPHSSAACALSVASRIRGGAIRRNKQLPELGMHAAGACTILGRVHFGVEVVPCWLDTSSTTKQN